MTVEKKACFRLRLDSVLGQLVPSNGALPREPHRAHRGSARLLARVGPLVRFNVALLGEPGPHRASVRLLARVAQAPTSGRTPARNRTFARCAPGGSARRATFPRTSGPTRARSRTLARCVRSGSPQRVALTGTSGPTRARGRTLARCAHGGSATRATFPRTGGPTRARSHTLARCAQSGSHRRAKLCRTSGPTPQTKPSTAASQPAVRPIEFCSKLTNSMPPSTTAAPTPCSLTPGDARCAIRSRNLITLTIESHKKSGQYI